MRNEYSQSQDEQAGESRQNGNKIKEALSEDDDTSGSKP
jgi:hypothetical protein